MSKETRYGGIYAFLLRVLLWLPVCFVAWYFLAPALLLPVIKITDLVMSGIFPHAFDAMNPIGAKVEVLTNFNPDGKAGGQLYFEFNPLIYSYSLPLLTGLILAVPEPLDSKWTKIAIGLIVLIPMQSWGLSFEILKTLAFSLPPEFANQITDTSFGRNAIALGYQFGYLIMPAVAPLIAWVAMYNGFVATLVPSLNRN